MLNDLWLELRIWWLCRGRMSYSKWDRMAALVKQRGNRRIAKGITK